MSFKDIPIQKKLMRFIFFISTVVLMVTCIIFFTYELYTFRKATLEKLSTIGKIISANSTAALAFNNYDDAREILSALKSDPHIVGGALYTIDGTLFSKYPVDLNENDFPDKPGVIGYHFSRNYLEGFHPVLQKTKQLGTLYLKSDLGAMYKQFQLYGIVVVLVIILSFLFAYLFSRILQKSISKPILALAETAKVISDKSDYSIRAIKLGKDELGFLTDAFNQMLVKIQYQNQALSKFNKKLEQKVKERTTALEAINKYLEDSEKQIQSIFNCAPDAVIVINHESSIIKWNHKAEKLFGWEEYEVIGKPLHEFIIPKRHQQAHINGMNNYLSKGESIVLNKDIEIEAINRKGIEFNVLLSISPVETKDKILFIGFIRDVTEKKKAEEALRVSEEKFNKAFQLSPAGVVLINLVTGDCLDINDSFLEIMGLQREEVIGGATLETGILNIDLSQEILEEIKQKGSVKNSEIEFKKKSGEMGAILFSTELIVIGQEKCSLTIIYDITYRKKAEAELKRKSEELIRSNQELEQFAYVASHDLQEPLRMVTSYVQLLSNRYKNKLDEDANDFIEFAVDGSNRMRILINSLLEYSRVNRIKPFEIIKMEELLNGVLGDLKKQIQENDALIKIDPLPDTWGDFVLIGQLFQNLITNAIKFKGEKKPEIHISCTKEKKTYLFSVKDNGIGFDKSYAEKIFVIFQRLHSKEKYSGTGIGLAICKKIVERHRGKIWVESEINKGSTFYFTIPEKNTDY